MAKRDSWDKLNRRNKALKPDYLEELRQKPRSRTSSINIEALAERAIRRMQREAEAFQTTIAKQRIQLCSPIRYWLTRNQIDEKWLANPVSSALGNLKSEAELDRRLKDSPGILFWAWNRQLAEAEAIASFKIPEMPKKLVPWLLKFKRKEESGCKNCSE
jgi:hypothetical protein